MEKYIYVQVPKCARFGIWDDFPAKVYRDREWNDVIDIVKRLCNIRKIEIRVTYSQTPTNCRNLSGHYIYFDN